MKNLVLTLFVAPLICFLQLSAGVQLLEVDPSRVIVDHGLYIEHEGAVIPVNNLILRDHKVLAVLPEEHLNSTGWIFFPPDAVRYFPNKPMSNVLPHEETFEKEFSTGINDEPQQFVETKGAVRNWLNDIFNRTGDRSFPIETRRGCSCKSRRGARTFINGSNGDILISIEIESNDYTDDQVVRVYIEDEEVAEYIAEATDDSEDGATDLYFNDSATVSFDDGATDGFDNGATDDFNGATNVVDLDDEDNSYTDQVYVVEFDDEDEGETDSTLVIGYDLSGAYYYNPNSFFQLKNPSVYNPHR